MERAPTSQSRRSRKDEACHAGGSCAGAAPVSLGIVAASARSVGEEVKTAACGRSRAAEPAADVRAVGRQLRSSGWLLVLL